MFDSLWPNGLQPARAPCPSPTPGVYSNSCPSSRWCHPTISSSVISFSSRLQSFPASGSFPMNQFFASGGQSIGVSASTSVLPMNSQNWSPLGWTGWVSLCCCGRHKLVWLPGLVWQVPCLRQVTMSEIMIIQQNPLDLWLRTWATLSLRTSYHPLPGVLDLKDGHMIQAGPCGFSPLIFFKLVLWKINQFFQYQSQN